MHHTIFLHSLCFIPLCLCITLFPCSHWDHAVLPHWSESIRRKFQHGQHHHPPGDIHAPFYPLRGTYSSRDPALLASHMAELRAARVNVVVLSWWGHPSREGTTDTQGVNTDALIGAAISAVEDEGLAFAFHLEPYSGGCLHCTVWTWS